MSNVAEILTLLTGVTFYLGAFRSPTTVTLTICLSGQLLCHDNPLILLGSVYFLLHRNLARIGDTVFTTFHRAKFIQ